MTEPIKVYPGYPLDRAGRWVGITDDHQFVTGGPGDTISPVGGWGKNPLAHVTGIEMFIVLLNVDREWRDLTKAQRRCLQAPETRTARPWAALVDKGLAHLDGLTTRGHFLRRAHERTEQRKEAA